MLISYQWKQQQQKKTISSYISALEFNTTTACTQRAESSMNESCALFVRCDTNSIIQNTNLFFDAWLKCNLHAPRSSRFCWRNRNRNHRIGGLWLTWLFLFCRFTTIDALVPKSFPKKCENIGIYLRTNSTQQKIDIFTEPKIKKYVNKFRFIRRTMAYRIRSIIDHEELTVHA